MVLIVRETGFEQQQQPENDGSVPVPYRRSPLVCLSLIVRKLAIVARGCPLDYSTPTWKLSTRYHASDCNTQDETASYTHTQSAKTLRIPASRPKGHRHGSTTADPHRVQISSEVPDVRSQSYHLEIVQHPIKAAEFGNSTLTRLPLAPPLIAQLHVHGHASAGTLDESDLPFLIAHLSLYSADGATLVDLATDGAHASPARMLYGSLVSSPHVLRNLQGRQGVYFYFPDVSIRWRGRFQLSVTLIKLPGFAAMSGGNMMEVDNANAQGLVLDQVRSHTFDVHSRHDYVAPAQTPLTQYFLQQGARMYAFATSVQFVSGSR